MRRLLDALRARWHNRHDPALPSHVRESVPKVIYRPGCDGPYDWTKAQAAARKARRRTASGRVLPRQRSGSVRPIETVVPIRRVR